MLPVGLAALLVFTGTTKGETDDGEFDGSGLAVVRRLTLNEKADGYRGIWFAVRQPGEFSKYKYSGGLGTYPAKQQPFAVYSPEVDKTFFCFGGAAPDNDIHLLHMVSYFDHATGEVPRPTILLDKQTSDAHDNPVLSIDTSGYIWIFSPSHGRARPSYIHRSRQPWDIDEFELVMPTYHDGKKEQLVDNFSYVQVFFQKASGFSCFFTRYDDPAQRTSFFMFSSDGQHWIRRRPTSAIAKGHYQVAGATTGKIGTMMNFHPQENGINGRTNLYYLESIDQGATWQNAQGEELAVPLTSADNKALVRDTLAEERLVFLKDLEFDADDNPVLLYLTSNAPHNGTDGDPRIWTLARFDGVDWHHTEITRSDHNYDFGSLDIQSSPWRLLATTAEGPQAGFAGGEVVLWTSGDRGQTWQRTRQLTRNSRGNHSYPRLAINGHEEFYALWADSNPAQASSSEIYFCNAAGDVFRLPVRMQGDSARPQRVIDRSE